jgi:predicted PurR-regulated permease PerM
LELGYNKKEVSSIFFGVLLILGLLLLAYLIKPVLIALNLTLVLVYLLYPVVEKIHPILKRQWLVITVTFIFILVPFFIFSIIVTTTLFNQIMELSKTPQVKELLDLLGKNFKGYLELPSDEIIPIISLSTFTTFGDIFTQGLGSLINFIKSLGGLFLQILLGIFLTAYLLFKTDSILELYSSITNYKVKHFFQFVDEALKQVVYSMFLTALITGIVATIIYATFGVPFAVLLGTTTGIVALVPLLGTWLVYLPMTVYFLLQGKMIFALVFFVVCLIFVTTLPDVAVRPIIASKKIDIGLIVLGFITGTLAFGAIGIIMGPLIIISWVAFVKIFLLEEKG